MSAYIVEADTIQYLVSSGLQVMREALYWYHRETGTHYVLTNRTATEVGQMLWNENMESVRFRYPREELLPGLMDEEQDMVFAHQVTRLYEWNTAQVLKATDCYEYQSCEHTGWEVSNAKAFIDVLRASAWRRLPGYEQAEWGHPKPAPFVYLRDL